MLSISPKLLVRICIWDHQGNLISCNTTLASYLTKFDHAGSKIVPINDGNDAPQIGILVQG